MSDDSGVEKQEPTGVTGREFEVKARNSAENVGIIIGVFIVIHIFYVILSWEGVDSPESAWALAYVFVAVMGLLLVYHIWESVYQMLRLIAILTKEKS